MKIIFQKKILKEIDEKTLKRSGILKLLQNKKSANLYQFNSIFEDKWRLTFPIGEGSNTEETDKVMLHYIDQIKNKLGYEVNLNEPFGYATKTSTFEKDGKVFKNVRKVKIGPLFAKLGKEAAEFWQKYNKFYTSEENRLYFATKYTLILSRHPIDILRMSDMDGWSSCHGTQGSYWHCAVDEATGGGAVAYIVSTKGLKSIDLESNEIFSDKSRDVPGIQPVSRLRVRRIIARETGDEEFAVPERRIYGQNFPGFFGTLLTILRDKQKDFIEKTVSEGGLMLSDWSLIGGEYEDNDAFSLIKDFFSPEINKGQIDFNGYLGDVISGMGQRESWNDVIEDTIQKTNNDKVTLWANIVEEPNQAIEYGAMFIVKLEGNIELYNKISRFMSENKGKLYKYLEAQSYYYSRLINSQSELEIEFDGDTNEINFSFDLLDEYNTTTDVNEFISYAEDLAELASGSYVKILEIIISFFRQEDIIENPYKQLQNPKTLKNITFIREYGNYSLRQKPEKRALIKDVYYIPELYNVNLSPEISSDIEDEWVNYIYKKIMRYIRDTELIIEKQIFESFIKSRDIDRQHAFDFDNQQLNLFKTSAKRNQNINNFTRPSNISQLENCQLRVTYDFDLHPSEFDYRYSNRHGKTKLQLGFNLHYSESAPGIGPETFVDLAYYIDNNSEQITRLITNKVVNEINNNKKVFVEKITKALKDKNYIFVPEKPQFRSLDQKYLPNVVVQENKNRKWTINIKKIF